MAILSQFERVLLQAVSEDYTLPLRDKRRIRLAVFFGGPKLMKRIEQAVIQTAVEEGRLPEDQLGENIDWDKLLAFIKEIIAIIIALIAAGG